MLTCERETTVGASASFIPVRAAQPDLRRTPRRAENRHAMLFGDSRAMAELRTLITRVADLDVPVLIEGETGTGKELVARAIAESSVRRGKPFVKVNCAALPGDLFESELFGFEPGAFTGAVRAKAGKFDVADGGTIFLDEIGEIPLSHQSKLLQVLQDGHYSRVGGNRDSHSTARVIAATNRDLRRGVIEGWFREDLLYRLNVIPMRLPSLRQRKGDIPQLIAFFAERWTTLHNRPKRAFSMAFIERCMRFDWPGNVRELESVIQRVVLAGSEEPLEQMLRARVAPVAGPEPAIQVQPPQSAPVVAPPAAIRSRSLRTVAREAAYEAEGVCIEHMLRTTKGNRRQAALNLGVCYKSLLAKAKEHGL